MIEGIAYAIAALGALLVLLLIQRLLQVDAELKLKKHRSTEAGLSDLLNHAAMVDDGVIVGKNGAFMAAWLYRGDDNASSTDAQRELVSLRINQALAGLGNGWMIHVDAVRRPAANYSAQGVSHFADSLTEAMDEERRAYFESDLAITRKTNSEPNQSTRPTTVARISWALKISAKASNPENITSSRSPPMNRLSRLPARRMGIVRSAILQT